VLKVPLHLFNEPLPLLRVVSACTGSLLPPDDNESGEPISSGEKPIGHEVLTLCDHFELCMVNELNLLFHTIFIALADHGDDEIHEDNVPDDQNEEPEEPCEEFEFCRALNNGRGIVVTNGLTQNNHEKSC
jgi:hypothetical protein